MTSAETETRTIRCNKAAKASKQLKPWYNLCNYLFCKGVKIPRIHLYIIALSQNCYVFLQQDGLPQMLLICSMLRGHLLNTLRQFPPRTNKLPEMHAIMMQLHATSSQAFLLLSQFPDRGSEQL